MTQIGLSGSIIDILSMISEILVIIWFFCRLKTNDEANIIRRVLALIPLVFMVFIYLTPLNAATNAFTLNNIVIQAVRMLLHMIPIALYIIIDKACRYDVAIYLSGIFTSIYLTAQNCRMILMTYCFNTPLNSASGSGYIIVLGLTLLIEIVLAYITRRTIKPELIDTIDWQRGIVISIVLVIMVYLKWILIAIRELKIDGNPVIMISFSLLMSLGMFFILLIFDYSRLLQKEKRKSDMEKMALEYWRNRVEREKNAKEDIRRIYHDVKNHLLAIQSMSGDSMEIKSYLQDLLPRFEEYETQVITNNEIVDALISDKIYKSHIDDIKFNVYVNLKDIEFIKTVDLVTIFGNAIDNAIEAVRKIEDKEKRYVFIKSASFVGNTVISFRNYYNGRIVMKDGRPVSDKGDSKMHGIGIGSIENAAQRYGGTIGINVEEDTDIFTLNVIIPTK